MRNILDLLAEKYYASGTDITVKAKTLCSLYHHNHKKLCENQVDQEKICPRMVRLPSTQISLDVDTPRGGYSAEKVGCHKCSTNST
jgi:hypothetical protein